MLSRASLGLIYLYQTVISPNKGYRCAHSVLHGGPGCSGFAKHEIRDQGLWGAIPNIRQRFAACREAHDEIKERDKKSRQKIKDSEQKLCNKYDAVPGCCDCGTCFGSGRTLPTGKSCGANLPCDGPSCDVCSCG